MTYKYSQTVDLCYFKHPTGESCSGKVQWAIKTERGNMFKVCDAHLPWSLHFSGLPARVNSFEPATPRQPEQLEQCDEEDTEMEEEPTVPFIRIKH